MNMCHDDQESGSQARTRLYHLRQLRKCRVSPAILKTFYSGAIESVLNQCISVWYRGAGTGGAEGAAAPPVFSVGNCKLL